MTADPYRQSVLIHARREDVFRYFTEAEAIVAWMGDAAVVDPQPGGLFLLRFADKFVEGRYVEIDVPKRLVITWGRRGSLSFPPGESRLEITLTTEESGTRVELAHFGLPADEQERHSKGWVHYMKRLVHVLHGLAVEAHFVPSELTAGVKEPNYPDR